MSTLGYTSVGGTTHAVQTYTVAAFGPFAASANGTITSVSVYTDIAVPMTVGVYADSSGTPGAVVAASSGGTSTAGGWTTMSVSGSLTSGSSYWVGVHSDTAGVTFYFDAGTHEI